MRELGGDKNARLLDLFNAIDTDGDGSLSHNELLAYAETFHATLKERSGKAKRYESSERLVDSLLQRLKKNNSSSGEYVSGGGGDGGDGGEEKTNKAGVTFADFSLFFDVLLKVTFDKLDEDSNGTLDESEMRKAVALVTGAAPTAAAIAEFLQKSDVNKDNLVDYEEFCDYVISECVGEAKGEGGAKLPIMLRNLAKTTSRDMEAWRAEQKVAEERRIASAAKSLATDDGGSGGGAKGAAPSDDDDDDEECGGSRAKGFFLGTVLGAAAFLAFSVLSKKK